jgi:hypothetical protein
MESGVRAVIFQLHPVSMCDNTCCAWAGETFSQLCHCVSFLDVVGNRLLCHCVSFVVVAGNRLIRCVRRNIFL